MDLLPFFFPGLEARRRWKLRMPDSFEVRVDPALPWDELVRRAGFRGVRPFDRPGRPLSEIYAARGGEPYIRRFELLQLCSDVDDADVFAMAAAIRAGRDAEFGEICRRSEERRQSRGERLSIDVNEAPAEMARRGYRPADACEFLSFLAQHHRRLRPQHDIYALGAVHRDEDRIYALGVFDRPRDREYRLVFALEQSRWLRTAWLSHHRFLATRLDR